ncbi:MAG: methyltransferase, partial [Vicinamibacterales bacterium]
MVPSVAISSRGEERLRGGHPWIYRADVVEVRAEAGDVVLVRGARGRAVGRALYSDRSQIALRILTLGGDADEGWLRRRLESAIG